MLPLACLSIVRCTILEKRRSKQGQKRTKKNFFLSLLGIYWSYYLQLTGNVADAAIVAAVVVLRNTVND